MIDSVVQEIEGYVYEYSNAEEQLARIALVESVLDEEFAEDLALIDSIQKRMQKRLQVMLSEKGVEENSKYYETVQKEVRKKLFPPMTVVVDQKHPDVSVQPT